MTAILPITPFPKKVIWKENKNTTFNIEYHKNPALSQEEYVLDIDIDAVKIFFNDDAAKQYAEETLRQIKSYYKDGVPCLHIEDKPDFSYRGFMLDVGRYFFSVDAVKSIIDDMAALKLNVLHLHLTEDQGWRIQIKDYPLLTEIGSKRSHTNFNHKPHGGFFTKEQLKNIVKYAHEKNVRVIPEIDMPGHMRSALASYPYLGCFGRKLQVATHWGVKHDILCAGKQTTYKFIGDVIDEVAEIFTDGYIHLGGDEAVKTRWELCPDCQRLMREQGIEDEDGLQTYFINKVVNDFLKPKGIKAVLWSEEHIPKGLDNSVVLQWYSNKADKQYLVEADGGRQIVNSNSEFYYADFPYSETGIDKAYGYETADKFKKGLLGGEICLWTEYAPNLKRAKYMAFPRSLAAAESFWGGGKDFNDFMARAAAFYEYRGDKQYCPLKKSFSKGKPFDHIFWKYLRQLHWEGLTILIDNSKVKKLAKKQEKEVIK